MSSGVEVQVVRVGKLTAVERAQMEALYRAHYEGAADAAFARDLDAKDLTDRLKSDVLRMDEESVRFRRLNPVWAKGEELCCFVPLAMDNLNRLGERVIGAVEPEWRV